MPGGQHEDGHAGPRPDFMANVDPSAVRQTQVKDDQVRTLSRRDVNSFSSGRRLEQPIRHCAERVAECAPNRGVVFDDHQRARTDDRARHIVVAQACRVHRQPAARPRGYPDRMCAVGCHDKVAPVAPAHGRVLLRSRWPGPPTVARDMKPRFFKSPAEFRGWLQTNGATARELLVGFYKKGSGKPSITWPESVDQALCFGWIDGIRRSRDDTSYTIRFTPRRARSIWSAVNIKRARQLARAGLMRPPGFRAFEARHEQRSGVYSFEQRSVTLPVRYGRKLKQPADSYSARRRTFPPLTRRRRSPAPDLSPPAAAVHAARERRLETPERRREAHRRRASERGADAK